MSNDSVRYNTHRLQPVKPIIIIIIIIIIRKLYFDSAHNKTVQHNSKEIFTELLAESLLLNPVLS